MGSERRMALDRGQSPLARTLVGHFEACTGAECERRIQIEEETAEMVVVEEDEHVGVVLGGPRRARLGAAEQRGPGGILLFALVVGEPYGGHMRCADSADNACHRI